MREMWVEMIWKRERGGNPPKQKKTPIYLFFFFFVLFCWTWRVIFFFSNYHGGPALEISEMEMWRRDWDKNQKVHGVLTRQKRDGKPCLTGIRLSHEGWDETKGRKSPGWTIGRLMNGMLMFIILIRLSIEINPRHSHCAYQQRVCQDAGAK